MTNLPTQRAYGSDLPWGTNTYPAGSGPPGYIDTASLTTSVPEGWDPSSAKGQILSLQATAPNVRNRALATLLDSYRGPGMEGVFASAPRDALARRIREARREGTAALAGRGLIESGARADFERGLLGAQMEAGGDITQSSEDLERERRLGLLQQISQIANSDLDFMRALADARYGSRLQEQARLAGNTRLYGLGTGVGVGEAAKSIAGAYGGAGGGAGANAGGYAGLGGQGSWISQVYGQGSAVSRGY